MDDRDDSWARRPPTDAEAFLDLRPYGEPAVEPAGEPAPVPRGPRPRWRLAVALFLATVASTFLSQILWGAPTPAGEIDWRAAFVYAGAVMSTLLCHELGHYLMARRRRVPASPPYFIPMPLGLFGTLGAVILMPARLGDRRRLFDVAVAGPLAGLPLALLWSVVGLQGSEVRPIGDGSGVWLGESVLFKALVRVVHGELPADHTVMLSPLAFAGWVGLFVTALNLVPIGQLDGGHILYALLRRRAHPIAMALMTVAVAATLWAQAWVWSLMILLLLAVGVRHPPTADDDVPLGAGRAVLGWLCLLVFVAGFTLQPIEIGGP